MIAPSLRCFDCSSKHLKLSQFLDPPYAVILFFVQAVAAHLQWHVCLAMDLIVNLGTGFALLLQELVSLHEGIRNRVVDDDETFKALSAASQEAMLPKEKVYVPAPIPDYLSDWEEEAAGFTEVSFSTSEGILSQLSPLNSVTLRPQAI